MIIKGWIKAINGWLNKGLYIVDDEYKELEKNFDYNDELCRKLEKFENKFVKCRYAIKDKKFDDITKELLFQLYGDLKEEDIDFCISDVTTGSYYQNTIGGHNLTENLKQYHNKYVIIEIEEVEKPKWLIDDED